MSKRAINVTRILTIFMFIFATLSAVTLSVFEVDFYSKVQKENNVAEMMGLSERELEEATLVSLLYTKGYTDDLSYYIERDNQKIDIYSAQDKEHMIDVANLYSKAYSFLIFSSVIILVLSVYLLIIRKEVTVFTLTETINRTSLYTLVFVAFIGIFAFANFNVFWTMFHKVFFSNDLWLMNPNVDALVNLFPEALFSALVFKILFRFIMIFGLINISAFAYRLLSIRGYKND